MKRMVEKIAKKKGRKFRGAPLIFQPPKLINQRKTRWRLAQVDVESPSGWVT